MTNKPQILDLASSLTDLTRCRLLQLVEGRELTVSELCAAVQLPQSTVSRHLRVLADGGWLGSRREGTSRFYRLTVSELKAAARPLWRLFRDQLATTPVFAEDRARLDEVLALRQTRSRQFFNSTAGRWDRLRDDLFGSRFDLQALLGLLDSDLHVADLACGTGRVAECLAPFVGRVVAVDGSSAMLEAARQRLAGRDNVEVRRGDLENLPFDDRELDAATLFLALHHVPDPALVVAEAHRVLKPGGRLLVVDMAPHEREDFRREMGHVWLGFSSQSVLDLFAQSGFGSPHYHPLPIDTTAKGPALFTATARRDGPARISRVEPHRVAHSGASRGTTP